MSRFSTPVIVLLIAFVLVAVGFALFRTSDSAAVRRAEREVAEAAPGAASNGSEIAVVAVDFILVEPQPATVVVDLSGVLEAVRKVTVGAEVEGRVVEIEAIEHTHVEAGDVLVRLDPELAEAAVRRSQASVVRAEATQRLARAEYGRQTNLSSSGVASNSDYDRAASEAGTSAATVAEAQAQLAEAQTRLNKTRITAPFAAVVSLLDLEPGAYLRPGDPVAELVDLSQIEIEIGVDDRQILALRKGEFVKVEVDAYPGEWFEGHIHQLGRAPRATTLKYPVPIRVDNADERLLPGMLGGVRLSLGGEGEVLRVPRLAIQREFDLDYLFVLAPGSGDGGQTIASRRRVRTEPVAFRPDLIDIKNGLSAGERIATSNLSRLRDGMPVQVRPSPGGSVASAQDPPP